MKKYSIVLGLMSAMVLIQDPLSAQRYFGQNRVRFCTFEFKILQTTHFDIYYYDEEERVIEDVRRVAERWYAHLSGIVNHQLSSRQPLVIYANHADFEGTTVIPSFIGESVGGVTCWALH